MSCHDTLLDIATDLQLALNEANDTIARLQTDLDAERRRANDAEYERRAARMALLRLKVRMNDALMEAP